MWRTRVRRWFLRVVSRLSGRVVCSIGCTDPTAAAGLFADAAVYQRIGVAGVFVVTGITAQNSDRVSAVRPVPPSTIVAQLESIWEQVRPDAVRVGLVPGALAIDAVCDFLAKRRRRPPIVVDPVLTASSGYTFVHGKSIDALRRLARFATLLTPNVHEAAVLARMPVRNAHDAERASRALAASGIAVLVTGGHLPGRQCVDILARGGRIRRYTGTRLAGDMRGSGCVLAAAIAAQLAKGDSLDAAVRSARSFVRRAMTTARPLGSGRPQLR
jgi:hydroxymethylpyrimidine kinase/phosphomethylpyrimidine kinase